MAEYIEKEAAIRALLNDYPEQVSYSREDAADCIRYMDTADVSPVRHERCEYCKDGKSFSGQRLIFGNDGRWHTIQFCPVCGCKMDGGEQDA